jgi:CRISPR-associated protein (TIGR02710 family)
MIEADSAFLVCTVGGSPEPVVAALKMWRPARVRFVHTPQTKGDIEAKIVPKARDEGVDLDPGRYDLFELPDGQDLARCLDRLRQLTPEVMRWSERDQAFRVVVDFTGGTKCMSAAIVLQASRWPCTFSYVGGGERTKDGVGVVVSGAEEVVHQVNPWDALGHRAVDDFVVLFDQHAFLAAANVAAMAKKHVSGPDRKRELAVLEQLAKAFDAWDRFDHQSSSNTFDSVAKSANDLRAVLGPSTGDRVLERVKQLAGRLRALCPSEAPSLHHVVDLIANAKRRKEEGRIDDAVARLYRAIEAVAQWTLRDRHGIESTERVSLDRVPETLRAEWAAKARDGVVALGLQDAYALLANLGDPLSEKFDKEGLTGTKSPLSARNRSILAHGFECVSESVFERLWNATLAIAAIEEDELPTFPRLGEAPVGNGGRT